jgi:methylisocitrate lyase
MTLKSVSISDLSNYKIEHHKWVMLTSYEALTAKLFEELQIPVVLVGDSAAQVVYGYDSTLPVSIEELTPLVSGVARSNKYSLIVADLPFGSYQTSSSTALESATKFLKAGAHAVKLEGGERIVETVKALVEAGEMCDRIKAAVDARTDPKFVIMARTDALASEGMQASLDRCHNYLEAGADMIFAEAVRTPDQYRQFTSALSAPVLANMTEFGQSPLLSAAELGELGIRLVLYPLSAFRAMNAAAEKVYREIRHEGTQRGVLSEMQTRERLYEIIHYHQYEQALDRILGKKEPS